MKPVLKNKLFMSSVLALTQAWDEGHIRGQSYANAVATLAMYLRKHTPDAEVVRSYTLRVIKEDKTCLID